MKLSSVAGESRGAEVSRTAHRGPPEAGELYLGAIGSQ